MQPIAAAKGLATEVRFASKAVGRENLPMTTSTPVSSERFPRLYIYVAATAFSCASGALGNAAWRLGWLDPLVPTDSAFVVAAGLIAAVALTIWRPRDAPFVWLLFLPIALALGAYSALATAGLVFGDSL
jgi:hypothetical protein